MHFHGLGLGWRPLGGSERVVRSLIMVWSHLGDDSTTVCALVDPLMGPRDPGSTTDQGFTEGALHAFAWV